MSGQSSTCAMLLLIVSGLNGCAPSPEVIAAADREEVAINDMRKFSARYHTQSDVLVKSRSVHTGMGLLAGQSVQCAQLDGQCPDPRIVQPRVMQIARTVAVVEGQIGRKPGVFDELWRRAGC